MFKFILAVIVLAFVLVTPIIGYADPFATCDCTPAVDKITAFELKIGTAAFVEIPAVLVCGPVTCAGDQRTLCYDLKDIPPGSFTLIARAKNLWGSSTDSLPLADTKIIPSFPLSLKIISK